MGLDYGEILCTAVDEIVSTRLQGLSYDITKLCTIVDDTYSYQGKYKVSDGTAKYDAFSTDNNLKKGNNVLVTIPNGDYTMQKTIKGRVAATDTTPFKYTSPLDTMISFTEDIFNGPQPEGITTERGLTANSNYKSVIGPIYSKTYENGMSGFTRLGISADFKSLLSGLDVAQGTYGIKLLIQSEAATQPGVVKEVVYDLDFNSSDMIGNPYQFEDYFTQEKVFDISFIEKIKTIEAYFYQNNNFKDGNGNLIPYSFSTSGEDIGLDKAPGSILNLFVDNVKVYLGYDINEFKDETLVICTNNSLSYHYTKSDNTKTMELRWIHKLEDGKHFTILSQSNFDENKYVVKWFRYTPGYEDLDKYAKKDWKEIPCDYGNPFSCTFSPDIKTQKEQIKVIGIIKDGISAGGQETESAYFSNILIFENEEYVPDSKTQDAAIALSIYCEDGTEGNYFIYNQNGKINNQGIGQGYKRTLKALFNGAEITSDIGTLDWIKWYFPYTGSKLNQNNSMLIMNGYFNDNEVEQKNYSYKGVNYWVVKRYPENSVRGDGKLHFSSDEQSYSITNQWSYKNSNNTIICRISVDGVEYEAIEEMRFGKSGTNGTNTTLVLELDDNKNALEAVAGNQISVSAWTYNEEGLRSGFAGSENINWSWFKRSNSDYMSFTPKGASVVITSNISYVPTDNYFILQAEYNGLVAYLPIPMKSSGAAFFEGAREIIYNHQGNPSYYNDIYNIYYYENGQYKKDDTVSWLLNYNESLGQGILVNSYMPTLKKQNGISIAARARTNRGEKVALSAPSFYASGYNDMLCVYGAGLHGTYWAQPILVLQSKYDFAMLNKWDGTLTIDEDNSTILSTMLGAGRKNSNNTFSGVLIGDIQKGTGLGDASILTGVYGLQEGKISYSLTEDGMATLGANGNGQIIIDGSKSEIKTKGYDMGGTSGMKIDLNTGLLNIRNGAHKSLINLSAGLPLKDINGNDIDNPYFLISTQDGKDLIRIDDNNYYLQSYNYTATAGSRYNLMTGEIFVAGPGGNFKVSPQGEGTPLLEINYLEGAQQSILMKVGANEYYLQSKDYAVADSIKVYNSYGGVVGDLYKIDALKVKWRGNNLYQANDGSASSGYTIINNNIYQVNWSNNAWRQGSVVNFEDVYYNYNGEGGNFSSIALPAQKNKEKYLAMAVKQYGDQQKREKGFKLDLNNNLIEGYDLYLRGIKTNDNNDGSRQIVIDSGAPTYPLRIGNNFAVDWDGNVYCTNPTLTGNGGNIELGSFHFSSSGAGGGLWNGDSIGINGFSCGPLANFYSNIWYQ